MPTFKRFHRGGSGAPLLCLHGFLDTWRSWDLILPALERRHDVLALTLPGHAGAAPLGDGFSAAAVTDAVERELDAIGWERADLVGNSLGGFVALELAARHRAQTVVALAPAGGWSGQDRSVADLLTLQQDVHRLARQVAPHAELVLASPEGRRRATRLITTNYEHIPAELLVHQLRGVAACDAAEAMIEHARRMEWTLDAQRIDCPVRVIWGTDDRLLPWPQAAHRFRHDWLPHADWVVLDGVGHCPQLDLPLETAQLILGFTSQSA
jgi:pimeloyl-ACP methyl ester carboxylesterase